MNHIVTNFLYNPYSSLAYVNTIFIRPYKWYRTPLPCRLEKGEVRKKDLFSKTKKKRRKKKMIHKIESLTAFSLQIYLVVRAPMGI